MNKLFGKKPDPVEQAKKWKQTLRYAMSFIMGCSCFSAMLAVSDAISATMAASRGTGGHGGHTDLINIG